MKILILGGTGAMGVFLVKLLEKQEVETFVTSRRHIQSKKDVHYLQGNAKNQSFLQMCLQMHKWDVIIDFMSYDTRLFMERIDLLLSSTKQYIFLSSARVYANSESPLVETSPRLLELSQDTDYIETDEYALSKARQEELLKNNQKKNWTVIRPYITYSETRLQLGVFEKEEWLYRALHGRTIIFSRDMMDRTTTLTYGLDVAKGIVSLIGKNDVLTETFHITTTENIKWEVVLDIYLSVIEKKIGFRPKVLLQDLVEFSEWRKNNKYQICYDRLYNRSFNNTKISRYVNVEDFSNIEISLKQCLEVFLEIPKFNTLNWKSEAKKDKVAKERTSIKEIPNIKQKVMYLYNRYF